MSTPAIIALSALDASKSARLFMEAVLAFDDTKAREIAKNHFINIYDPLIIQYFKHFFIETKEQGYQCWTVVPEKSAFLKIATLFIDLGFPVGPLIGFRTEHIEPGF